MLLGGYLILIRFFAVIMISILASLFWNTLYTCFTVNSESVGKTRTVNRVHLAQCGISHSEPYWYSFMLWLSARSSTATQYWPMSLVICWTGCSQSSTPSPGPGADQALSVHLGIPPSQWWTAVVPRRSIQLNGHGHYHLPPQQSLFCPLIVQTFQSPLHKCGTVHRHWPSIFCRSWIYSCTD